MLDKILRHLFTLLILSGIWLPAAGYSQETCISKEEGRLAEMINNLRKQNRLPEIALSTSLTVVAKLHVNDLQSNRPDTSICSTASWSNKGNWTPCCFTALAPNFECIWGKPKELTSYNFRGYEIVHYEEGIIQVDSMFALWLKTPAVLDMILGRNTHNDKRWAAIGLAVGENYVSVWLGQRADAAGRPKPCENGQNINLQISDNQIVIDTKPSKYYLIFASFSNRADANEAVRRFKNTGFPNANVLTRDGRFRVSINTFNDLKTAMEVREKLLADYPDIWILKD
jgi:hypothetical protein